MGGTVQTYADIRSLFYEEDLSTPDKYITAQVSYRNAVLCNSRAGLIVYKNGM